jgi:hypothetical protein
MADPNALVDSAGSAATGLGILSAVTIAVIRLLQKANDRVDSAHDRNLGLLEAELGDLRKRLGSTELEVTTTEAERDAWRVRALAAEAALDRLSRGAP